MQSRRSFKLLLALLAAVLLPITGASAQLISGLTAYWPLDQNTTDAAHSFGGSASVVDDSGGTFFGGAGYNTTDPLFGSGAYFGDDTSSSSRLALTNSADTNGASNNLTVSWWGRVEPVGFDTTWQGGVLTGEGNRWRFHRSGNSDTMAWQGGGGDISGTATVDDGNWHHMVGTTDPSGRVLYIDGVQVATGGPSSIDPSSSDLWIGNNPQSAGRAWDGSIDDVAIWNRAITLAEVQQIYNAGMAGNSLSTLFSGISDITFAPTNPPGTTGADGSMPSGAVLNSSTGTLTALDLGAAAIPGATYALVAGAGSTDNAKYAIGGAGSDELLVNTSLAGEGGNIHSVRVRATDGSNTLEKVFTIAIVSDDDSDNLSDAWEISHAGTLTFLTGLTAGPGPGIGTGDFDGDGHSDLAEMNAGTDPTDADSFPGPITPGLTTVGTISPSIDGTLPPRTPGGSGAANWQTEDFFTGQGNFADLKGLAAEPNSTYLAVVERRGTVQRVDASDRSTTGRQQILDIQSLTVNGDNGGLRSVVFHPQINLGVGKDYMYVFYSTNSNVAGFTQNDGTFFYRLSRFTRNPSTGVYGSELVMIQQMSRDQGQHFGGGLTFGTDGMLVITWGDMEFSSSRVGVPFYQDAQRIDRIFQAAVLRIDVDQQGGAISSPPSRTLQGLDGNGATVDADGSQSCEPGNNYYDIDNKSGIGYYIPDDNYFVLNPPPAGSASSSPSYPAHGDALGEHHAIGLRNPWRATTDPVTGDIAIFIVGSNGNPKSEEVDVMKPGGGENFGWAYREGDHLKSGETGRTLPPGGNSYAPVYLGTERDPYAFWEHSSGNGNIASGGLYYRGSQWPSLAGGKLIAADHGSGKIWSIDYLSAGTPSSTYGSTGGVQHPNNFTINQLIDTSLGIRQMSASPDGQEILIAANSNIWRLYNSAIITPEPPALLSSTGAFTALTPNLVPHSGLVPYKPAAPLWSDRAKKFRWIGVPNQAGIPGQYDQPSEKIIWSENGEWDFPEGTTFVKHFELPTDERDPSNPALQHRLETRFLINGDDGNYFAFTYKWNAAGTEANLIPDGPTTAFDEPINVIDENGTSYVQTWKFPSRSECMQCHQTGAGHVLGMKTRQQNCVMEYPSTGVTSNQLSTLNSLGMFESPSFVDADLPFLTSSVHVEDTSQPLELRVRSYIDSNCSMCHRPGSQSGLAAFDGRLITDLALAGIIDEVPHAGDLGIGAGARIVKPGDPLSSVLYVRDSATAGNPNIMPPLARSVVHDQYVTVLAEWIGQLGLSNYNVWANARGITSGALQDHELDDVINVAEFVYGTNGLFSDLGSAPDFIDTGGGVYTMTLPIEGDALTDGIGVVVEGSTDNMVSWQAAGAAGSGLQVLQNTASAGVDGVLEVGFAPGEARVFVRTRFTTP